MIQVNRIYLIFNIVHFKWTVVFLFEIYSFLAEVFDTLSAGLFESILQKYQFRLIPPNSPCLTSFFLLSSIITLCFALYLTFLYYLCIRLIFK